MKRVALVLSAVVIAVAAWAMGTGQVAFVVTTGISMEPLYHTGDLVVIEKAGSYHIGDIVAYHGDLDGHPLVLHRIIAGDSSGFVIKGDNNQSVDPGHPTSSQVIGRAILHVPKVGRFMASPIFMALVAAAVAAFVLAVLHRRRGTAPATRPEPRAPVPKAGRSRPAPSVLDAFVLADVLLLVGVVLSFALGSDRAGTAATRPTQTGALTYEASVAPSDTYPTGKVVTGDPVFLRLVKTFGVSFHYTTSSPVPVTGRAQLDAVVSEQDGWHTTLPLVAPTPLAGGAASLTATVDLARIQALAARVAQATGIASSTMQIDITATVQGQSGGPDPATFTSHLPFQVSPLEMVLTGPTAQATEAGPAISTTVPLGSPPPARPQSDHGREEQFSLLAALVACLGATVIAWPS